MSFFDYRDGVLCAEGVTLPAIAEAVGTPVHVYSAGALRHAADAFSSALRDLPSARFAFAVKANPNGAVLRLLAQCGYGADIVSGGELRRALNAGIAPADVVFSGVGKTDRELIDALEAGIGQFNLELEEEGRVLAQLARRRGLRAPAVLRVNPDVMAERTPRSRPAGGPANSASISRVRRTCTIGSPGWTGSICRGSHCISEARSAIWNRWRLPTGGSAHWFSNCAREGTRSPVSIWVVDSGLLIDLKMWCRRLPITRRWSRGSRATGMSASRSSRVASSPG